MIWWRLANRGMEDSSIFLQYFPALFLLLNICLSSRNCPHWRKLDEDVLNSGNWWNRVPCLIDQMYFSWHTWFFIGYCNKGFKSIATEDWLKRELKNKGHLMWCNCWTFRQSRERVQCLVPFFVLLTIAYIFYTGNGIAKGLLLLESIATRKSD